MIDDFKWWHGIVLMVAIHIQQLASHIQFFFYTYLLIGIYYLYLLVVRVIKKEQWFNVLRSGIVFGLAAAFSFAMSADIYLSTLEYNPYSIRGTNPIVQSATPSQSKTAEGGLDYEYATNWSFSPGETMTFFIPSLYGFGDQTVQRSPHRKSGTAPEYVLGTDDIYRCTAVHGTHRPHFCGAGGVLQPP